jgi:chemotaxis signal transduction protein
MDTALLVHIDGAACAIPLSEIRQVLPMVAVQPLSAAAPQVLGRFRFRGESVVLFDVAPEVGSAGHIYGAGARIVILGRRSPYAGIPVDAASDLMELPAEPERQIVTEGHGALRCLHQFCEHEGVIVYLLNLSILLDWAHRLAAGTADSFAEHSRGSGVPAFTRATAEALW